ncbi:MAG TPA: PEP/pyruvate-binding domain-containing protein [Aromatoleum sp.]|uniref:PEP/pyruvate-binding domain-containing protein n=1 Tax=Aromatoleum sp. TaxID=2307007 RepID=UPI002B48ECC1|nr:PEP/pyruvate-binding domain-containing protein [Aromatoleum sp.]HJV26542.1 PEP/pyruvate-binding domain-containing protein [Aromatoleum sp.]
MSADPVLILDFAAAAEAGPAVAGGKGAQLGRLMRYGFPVPDGFVISTFAARFAMAGEGDAARAAGDDPHALAAVRARIESASLPPGLKDVLHAELRRRGWEEVALAVRSSAPMEDSGRASFAGIYRSELDVLGFDAVAAAVKAVWASLWTPQAVAYRGRVGVAEAAMAVVVMPMVKAIAGGVAFSCEPTSGRDDQVAINAVAGLADGLVAGRESGEEIILEADPVTEDYRVLRRRGVSSGLTDARAVELAHLVRETAFALDYAAPWFDIEWVWDGARFHLVQARPVTARPWHTYPALAGQTPLWSNGNTRDVAPHVMTACEWVTCRRWANQLLELGWRIAGYPVLSGAQRAALFQGRLYLNASFIQWEGYDAFGIAPAAMNRLLGGHHSEIVVPPPSLRDRAVRLGRMLRYLAKSGGQRRLGRRQVDEAHATCAVWRAEDLSRLSNAELSRRIASLGLHYRRQDGLIFLQGSSGGTLSMLLDLIERYLPGESHALAAALMAGGEPSVTARQAYELQTLAATASVDPDVAAWLRSDSDAWQDLSEDDPFRRDFADFLERYGHRGIYESYLRNPRWRDHPAYLLRQIAGLMDCDPAAMRARQAEAREAACERLAGKMPFWARRWAEALARTATRECNDREAARSAFTAYGEVARRLLLEAGRRLVASADLVAAEDIFHLTPPEFDAALAGQLTGAPLRNRVADRQRLCTEWEANPAPDVVVEGASASVAAAAAPGGARHGDWRGTAVGAGLAAGPARPVRSPEEGGRLAPGDILVAPSTDPAWTPLFLKAGGLVMETGGYLSHGAIVAREFAIPAVVNLPGILDEIGDGARVEVDGRRGTVRRIG